LSPSQKGVALAERINSKAWALVVVAALALCLPALSARAQGDPLPDPCKIAGFTPDEQQQIATFTENRLRLLGGEDQIARERARKELLSPLTRPCVSVAFRQLDRAAMIDDLTTLAGAGDDGIAITALVVLGELADDSARQVLQQYTADPRPAVRYAAIAALSRTLRAVNTYAPALDPGRATEIVAHLATRLTEEEDPQIVDLLTRALITGAAISRDGFAETASRALAALADGVGPRLRAASPEARPVVLLSALRTLEAMNSRLVGAGNVPAEIARNIAAFAGETLADIAHAANVGELAESRAVEVDIVNISERLLVFAHQKLGRSIQPPGLAAMLQAGQDKEFYAQVRQLVLSLEQAPVSLPPETTQRIRDALEGR
jgi:hypothetical protein